MSGAATEEQSRLTLGAPKLASQVVAMCHLANSVRVTDEHVLHLVEGGVIDDLLVAPGVADATESDDPDVVRV
ncbi:MAG: hypothetical protein WBD02_01590 [Acidimicrobiia bacterium]